MPASQTREGISQRTQDLFPGIAEKSQKALEMSRVAMRFYLDDSDDESKDESGEPAWLSTYFISLHRCNTNPTYLGLL